MKVVKRNEQRPLLFRKLRSKEKITVVSRNDPVPGYDDILFKK